MNKNLNFPLLIVAVILGFAIIKDFDFYSFSFKNLWLDIIYIIVFLISILFLFKNQPNSKK